MQEAKNIDEAIEILKDVVNDSIDNELRLGYFASLYCMVTMAVRDAINSREFEDNERMHKLDVIFANYFFKNLHKPDAVWNSYFDANESNKHVIMQHLLLGMNAHINYDLAQAVIDTQDKKLDNFHSDYLKINEILYEVVDDIQSKLNKTSIFLKIIDFIGWRFDETYADFSMIKARDRAWKHAYKLSKIRPEQKEGFLSEMKEMSLEFAFFIKKPSFIYKILTYFNKISEKQNIKSNLLVLKPF
jgi:hypothetical protein